MMKKFNWVIWMKANILTLFFVSTAAQTGFLNINCGAMKNFNDSQTNMTWTFDSTEYIDVGKAANVSNSSIPYYLQSLRFFPKPLNKSCYSFPVELNSPYLLRLWFVFGNYNGIQEPPSFNVSVETRGTLFRQMELFNVGGIPNWDAEKILTTSSSNNLYVCFIRTSEDSDPFVSAIQLRSLFNGMYALQDMPGKILSSVSRYDLGGQSSNLVRYPDDQYDRFWQIDSTVAIYNSSLVVNGSTKTMISSDNSSSNFPPSEVMQTAIVAKANVSQLLLNLGEIRRKSLVALYFGEIEAVNTSESRIFNVMINGQALATVNFSMDGYIIEKKVRLNSTQARQVIISLDSIKGQGNSTRGPLINALEHYSIIDTEPETYTDDVNALLNMKKEFGISDWISDPCFGIEWNGIKCDNGNQVRILEIDLSGRGLSGSIGDLCNLTRLEKIHLQDNKLSGAIPPCLSNFSYLKELYLQNNNFSGEIPNGLLKNRKLDFRYSGNRYLEHAKGKKIKVVIGSITGAILAVSLVLVSILIYRLRYSKKAGEGLTVDISDRVKSRSFNIAELRTATQNFSQQIGQGGFGSVYFGKLPEGKEVAVKVLSASSKQGVVEFLNEIDLLSRVNHKNLVSLLGYCDASKELMLVYEYMGGGTLRDHLYGSLANPSSLDWKARLRVALDAAEGLEYLHWSSTPKIIHRDVKSSNILLDMKLRAKVADFGLSKILGDDPTSHVTTVVKGTMGYMDPEYFATNKLTERSDVYSFGVVLLEMICGRKPIEDALGEEEINLVKWVMLHVEANEDSPHRLMDIVDEKICLGENDMESFNSVLDLAIKCVEREGSKRPTMSEVVTRIKEAMPSIQPNDTHPENPVEYSTADCSTSLLYEGR